MMLTLSGNGGASAAGINGLVQPGKSKSSPARSLQCLGTIRCIDSPSQLLDSHASDANKNDNNNISNNTNHNNNISNGMMMIGLAMTHANHTYGGVSAVRAEKV